MLQTLMNIRQPLSSMAVFFKRVSINIVTPEKNGK